MFTFYNFTKSKRRFHFPTPKISKSTLARLGRLPGRVFLRCGVVSGFLSRCCTLQCRENLTLRRSLIQKPPQVKNLLPKFAQTVEDQKSQSWEQPFKNIYSPTERWSLLREEDVQIDVGSPSCNCLHCKRTNWGEVESSQLWSEVQRKFPKITWNSTELTWNSSDLT